MLSEAELSSGAELSSEVEWSSEAALWLAPESEPEPDLVLAEDLELEE